MKLKNTERAMDQLKIQAGFFNNLQKLAYYNLRGCPWGSLQD